MSEDFNIKISVRNGRLLKAIRARYASVADLARKCHLHQTRVNSLVTMKVKPFNQNGWTDLALDVAAMVGKEPEYLWPDHLRELKLARSTSETEVGLDSVKKIIQDGSTEKTLSQISAISTLSKTLTPRERQCLAMRFAVGHTLDETAKIFGVTRERARQLEAKAIRKMKRQASLAGYRATGARHGELKFVPETKTLIRTVEERTTNKGLDLLND